MSTAPLPPLLNPDIQRHKFTRAEVEEMMDAGIFEDKRLELIDGALIDKMGQKPPHSFTIRLISWWLMEEFGNLRVRTQMPIEPAPKDRERSWPEPDIALLRQFSDRFQWTHPEADDLLLVAEVADFSHSLDLGRKAKLYASAGIPEYWVADLVRRQMVVHRLPQGTQYRTILTFGESDMIAIEGIGTAIRVGDLLPKKTVSEPWRATA